MIIKSLELENIRSYKKQLIEFEDGINFLSGDIGSGKSSVLLSIEFALFGFKRGDLEGYHLLRKGKLEGTVKLFLEENGKKIEIFRRIKKSKSKDSISQENGYVKIDENLMELSPQEINATIFELLSFPMDFLNKDKNLIYRFTIYTPQDQLKEILFAENEKRLEIIRKIFGIDKYKQLNDAISIYVSRLKNDFKIYEAKLEPLNGLREEVNKVSEELLEIKKEKEVFEKKYVEIKKNYSDKKEDISKKDEYIDKLYDSLSKLEKNIAVIAEIEKNISQLYKDKEKKEKIKKDFSLEESKNRLENYEDKIKKLEVSIKGIEDKIKNEDIDKEYDLLLKKKEIISKKLNDITNKNDLLKQIKGSFDNVLTQCQIKDVEVEIEKLNLNIKKFDKINKELEVNKKNLILYENEVNLLRKNKKEKNDVLSNVTNLVDCPTCFQKIDEEHKSNLYSKFDVEEKEIVKSIDLKLEEIEKIKLIISDLEEKSQKLLINEKSLVEKESKLKSLKEKDALEKEQLKKINLLEKEIKLLESEVSSKTLEDLDKEFYGFEVRKKDLNKLKVEKEQFQKEFSDFKLKIVEVKNGIENYNNLDKEIKDLDDKITKLLIKVERKEEFEKKIVQFRKKYNEFKESRDELKKYLDKINDEITEANSNLTSCKERYDYRKKELEKYTKDIERLELINKEYKRAIDIRNFLNNKMINISSRIEKAVFTKYYSQFNDEFEALFRQLIEDNEIDVRLDDEFSIIIEQNGYDIDVKNLSGGERSSLAIAYRLGLKKIIEDTFKDETRLNLLILDEPTEGFSDEQIDRLGIILKESNMKQILIVSHDDKIESISDKVLKVEKNTHISTIL